METIKTDDDNSYDDNAIFVTSTVFTTTFIFTCTLIIVKVSLAMVNTTLTLILTRSKENYWLYRHELPGN